MVEATRTGEQMFGLGTRPSGRGARLYAASITVSDADTLDTGLDTIESVVCTVIDAATAGVIDSVIPDVVAGGIITLDVMSLNATVAVDADRVWVAATGTNAYIVVVGSVR